MRSIQIFAILLAVAICVSTNYAQETQTKFEANDLAKAGKMLHGTWKGDVDKTREEIKKMKDLEMEEGMIDDMLEKVASITAKFQDGRFAVEIGDEEMKGEWKVSKMKMTDKLPVITVRVVPDEEAEGEKKNFEIHFIGKTHMKMIDLDKKGPPVVMKREDEEKKDT